MATLQDYIPKHTTPHALLLSLAEGGDFSFRVMADCLEDYNLGVANNGFDYHYPELAALLRHYSAIESYMRARQEIPSDMIRDVANWQILFDVPETLTFMGRAYTKRVGCFHTKITTTQLDLARNLQWLTDQPVREVDLAGVFPDNDLALILRNYRMEQMRHVTLRFQSRSQANDIATVIRQCQLWSCMELNLCGRWADPVKMVESAFRARRSAVRGGIGSGCNLQINGKWAQ